MIMQSVFECDKAAFVETSVCSCIHLFFDMHGRDFFRQSEDECLTGAMFLRHNLRSAF